VNSERQDVPEPERDFGVNVVIPMRKNLLVQERKSITKVETAFLYAQKHANLANQRQAIT
jgi:hypothetical protein